MKKRRKWKGQVVPRLLTKDTFSTVLSWHVGERRELLLSASKFDQRMLADKRIRQVFFAWKEHSPLDMCATENQMYMFRIEFEQWYEQCGDAWFDELHALMNDYLAQSRAKIKQGEATRISFFDFWTNRFSMLVEKSAVGEVVLYADLSRLSADDIRGEGECAVELAQRLGNATRRILDPARRIAVGLTDEPRTSES